jgi:uncharacterized protein (DUF2267 family)
MRFDEFINRVQERTRLDTREDAITITRAVLETLGERLDRKVRNGLEAQLPNELKEFLLARTEDTNRYNREEFYNRVGARADLKFEDAKERTRQVLAVLRQAIAEGEVQDILESLPDEYADVFGEQLPNRASPGPGNNI